MKNKSLWLNTVSVFNNGVKFNKTITYYPKKDKIQSRGKILGFSSHSRLRLRKAILENHLPNSKSFGLTLTVPWIYKDENLSKILLLYRKVFHRFCIGFSRKYQNSACIFRHELQQRKMPHTHIILYLSYKDYQCSDLLISNIKSLWVNSLADTILDCNINGFLKYGIKLDVLENKLNMYRYIADHTSKSKQAQLGYIGKQWGYINQKNFVNEKPLYIDFSTDEQRIFFTRHIKRLCHYSVKYREGHAKSFAPFGSRKIGNNQDVSIKFIHRKTLDKLIQYINQQNPTC